MYADYLVLCREVKTSESGTDLIGIYEQVQTLKLPLILPKVYAHIRLRAVEPLYGETFSGELVVEYENVKLFGMEFRSDDANALKNQRIPLTITLPNVTFAKSGDYYFKVCVDGKLLATDVLQVVANE